MRLTSHHIVPHSAITERTSYTQTRGEIPTVRHAYSAAHVVVYAQYSKATYCPSFPSTPSFYLQFHTPSLLVSISNGSIEKNACLGGKVKVRTISSSIEECITLRLLLFPDAKQFSPQGLTPLGQNAEKAILVQLPLPVRRQGRKKSSPFSMITHSRTSRYDPTF